DYVTNKGFEFGYRSPTKYKLGGDIVAAYTYGVLPQTTKHIVSEGEIVDAVELKDDALPEIPPFEATVNFHYKMLKETVIPRLTLRMVAAQNHISDAFYETRTAGFWVMNFSVRGKLTRVAAINAGISNI